MFIVLLTRAMQSTLPRRGVNLGQDHFDYKTDMSHTHQWTGAHTGEA